MQTCDEPCTNRMPRICRSLLLRRGQRGCIHWHSGDPALLVRDAAHQAVLAVKQQVVASITGLARAVCCEPSSK
jgi:hypothetical protein